MKNRIFNGNNPESNPNYRTIFLYGTRFDQFGAESTKIDNPDKIDKRQPCAFSGPKCKDVRTTKKK